MGQVMLFVRVETNSPLKNAVRNFKYFILFDPVIFFSKE
jgi:hypothetical protein